MVKWKVITTLLLCLLFPIVATPTSQATPPPPQTTPKLLGNFGDLRVNDSMRYHLLLSDNLRTFLESSLFRLVAEVVAENLAEGNETLENETLYAIYGTIAAIQDTTINCSITEVIPPNTTFIGEVRGNSTVTADLHTILNFISLIPLLNLTALFGDLFTNIMTTPILNQPSIYTILSNTTLNISAPLHYLPLLLSNNWSYWEESFQYAVLTSVYNLYLPIPLISQVIKPTSVDFFNQTYLGMPAWGVETRINFSHLVDTLLNETNLYYSDFFNRSFQANWSVYQTWLDQLPDLETVLWFHRESGVLIQAHITFGSRQFWQSVSSLLTNYRDSLAEGDIIKDLLDYILTYIGLFPLLGEVSLGLVLTDFVYNSTRLELAAFTPPDSLPPEPPPSPLPEPSNHYLPLIATFTIIGVATIGVIALYYLRRERLTLVVMDAVIFPL